MTNRLHGYWEAHRPDHPLDVAGRVRQRSCDERFWADVAARDHGPAAADLRRYVAERQAAWATAARLIESAARNGPALQPHWAVVDALAACAREVGRGPAGACYEQASCWLSEVLLSLEMNSYDDDRDS